jgi:hypothetical protein
VAQIVVLTMGAEEAAQRGQIEALGQRHAVAVIEPRWPECQDTLRSTTPGLVLVDASQAPSHGRAVARWMAGYPRFRTVPFLFLDVADRDMARVKKEIPRAQFGTWSSVVGASDRIIKR